jgi:hypothetical protein
VEYDCDEWARKRGLNVREFSDFVLDQFNEVLTRQDPAELFNISSLLEEKCDNCDKANGWGENCEFCDYKGAIDSIRRTLDEV